MTDRSHTSGDDALGASFGDAADIGRSNERRGPGRAQGDSRLPAHIMASVRQTIRAAAATCVDASRLESSGPYEWLAIVESRDDELYQLLRRFIEACRYLDELDQQGAMLGHARLTEAKRNAAFARESMRKSLTDAMAARRPGPGFADL